MHKAARRAVADGVGDIFVRYRGGKREVAAGQGFAQTHDVGHDVCVFAGKQLTRAPETGGDFVENQQHAVFAAQSLRPLQIFGRVKIHSARPLHDRLHNQRGDFSAVFVQQIRQRRNRLFAPRLAEFHRRLRQEKLHRQTLGKQAVHSGNGVAHRHRVPSVAVIARPQRGKLAAPRRAQRVLVLHRHLHCHFHRHRTAVGIKHRVQTRRQDAQQRLRQLCRRIVGETAEHDMAHLFKLEDGGAVQARMVVAVHRRPPRRHAVKQPPAVFQGNRYPVGPLDRINRRGIGGGGIRMPDMAAVEFGQGVYIHV